ncbi:acyl-CoA dehydrogenase [Gammaproteobacteria bacterium]|jgi:alkylation response protein AidB-like acyl-CoA dehydrogenase|nr:acyl-CoA dehydrogenase [Gammaproteobacteria bacterium]
MDFRISEEQQIAIDSIRRFLDDVIRPVLLEYDDSFIPKERMQEILKQLLDFGLGNGLTAESDGGMGLDPVTLGLLFEELARVSPDVAIVVLIQEETGLLLSAASDDIKSRYLGPLLEGNKFGSIGISEPAVGSNIVDIRCRAKADGDDLLISGEKQWISGGHYSDFNITVARESDDGAAGIGLYLVDRDQGYESQNIPKIALNRQSTAQLFFDNVRIPRSQMLFPPGEGLKRLMTLLEGSRPLVGLMAVGIAQAALDYSIEYAKEREQHGKPIGAHQLIQARVAEMAVKVEASRLMLFKALDQVGRGVRSDFQSGMAKYFATEAACEVTRHAMAIHGGNGVTREFPVEELYRMAPILTVTEGTPEMQKLIIGRSLLGMPAF